MTSFASFVFGVLTSVLNFGAHRVVLAWAERAFPALTVRRRRLLVASGVLAVGPWVSRHVLLRARNSVTEVVFALFFFELMIVVVAAVPLLVLLVATERSRRTKTLERAATEASRSLEPVGRRRAVEQIGGATILGATSAVFGWGMTVGRHDYRVEEVAVRIPGLAKELDGYVIAQISDIHAGLFVGERELGDARDLMRRVKPDLIVATGDLVDIDAGHAPELARALADLKTRDGVFAILGNHDYYAGHEAVSDALRAAGVTLLVNDARMIQGEKGGFALLGVDDAWSRPYGGPGPKLGAATASISKDAPRILLAHQPNQFHTFAGQVALQLSGHTHGGQIKPGNHLVPFASGRFERRGSTLYVNRGFGVAGPPARLGVPPEITKVILVAA
jgi:predicted MPP superfamily phosphohydrolase